jgi:hypothetical protein
MLDMRQLRCEPAYDAMVGKSLVKPEDADSSGPSCTQCSSRQATQRCGALDWASVCDECADTARTQDVQQHKSGPRQEDTPVSAQQQSTDKGRLLLFDRSSSQPKLVNFVHGEVTFSAVTSFLSLATLAVNEEFCDLGCGAGKAIVMAAMLWPFKRSWGMDLAQTQLEEGNVLIEKYSTWYDDSKNESIRQKATPPSQVSLEHGNILELDWSSADVVYICSTCFDKQQMAQLAQLALKLKIGARVITMDKQLFPTTENTNTLDVTDRAGGHEEHGGGKMVPQASNFEVVGQCECEMTWGTARAFVQRRVAGVVLQ